MPSFLHNNILAIEFGCDLATIIVIITTVVDPSSPSSMATDKRIVHSAPAADKEYDGSSMTFQMPTTSANNNINNIHNNNDNHISHGQINSIDHNNNDIINNHQQNGNNLFDYCHHQAATRSLLFNQHNSSEPLTTTESEESVTPPPHYHEIPGIVPAYQGRTSGPPPAYDDVVNPNAPPPSYQSLFGQVREASKTSNGLVDLFRQLFLILIGTIGCTMIIGFLLLIPITMILVGIFYVNECRAENIPSFLVIGGFVWIIKNILNCYNQFKKDSSTANRPPPRRTPISSSANGQSGNTTSAASVLIISSQTTPITHHDTNNSNNVLAINSHNSSSNHQIEQPSSSTTIPTTITRTRTTTTREHQNANHIRHPPMIGLTSYKCESILNYFLIVWFLAGCIVVYRIYEPDYDNPLSASYCNRTVYLYAFWLMTSAFIIMAIVLSCLCCLMASSLMSCNHGR